MFTPSPKNAPRELTEKELESVVAGAAAFAAMGAWARGVLELFSKVMDDIWKGLEDLTGGRVSRPRSTPRSSGGFTDVIMR